MWLNGYNWMLQIESKGLQLKGCNQSPGTEGLRLKCCNWMNATTCDWRVGANWFPTKGYNRPVETKVLQRKAWDWRPGTEVLKLKTFTWMLVTKGIDNWQLKFCYWLKGVGTESKELGLKVKCWEWKLGTKD